MDVSPVIYQANNYVECQFAGKEEHCQMYMNWLASFVCEIGHNRNTLYQLYNALLQVVIILK